MGVLAVLLIKASKIRMCIERQIDTHMEIASYALLGKGIILAFEAKIIY